MPDISKINPYSDAERRANRIAAGLPLGEDTPTARRRGVMLEEFLEDPGLAAAIREVLGKLEGGGLRSERAKEQVRRSFIPHSEAVVKMLRQRAGLEEENDGTGTGP